MTEANVRVRVHGLREGKKFCKELRIIISYKEIMNCKTLKSLKRYVQDKVHRMGIFSSSELEHAQYDDADLVESWKANKEVVSSLNRVKDIVEERWTLGPTHGISHWNRVLENGMNLLTDDVDPVVVMFFAYLHDSCREDDYTDIHHGERAAEWLDEIRDTYLKVLTDEQFFKLKEACRLHTTTHQTDDPTIDACFDADRLDLWRVGIKPNPKKMATPKGATLASQITDEKMVELNRKRKLNEH